MSILENTVYVEGCPQKPFMASPVTGPTTGTSDKIKQIQNWAVAISVRPCLVSADHPRLKPPGPDGRRPVYVLCDPFEKTAHT